MHGVQLFVSLWLSVCCPIFDNRHLMWRFHESEKLCRGSYIIGFGDSAYITPVYVEFVRTKSLSLVKMCKSWDWVWEMEQVWVRSYCSMSPEKKCVNHGIGFGRWNKYGCDDIVRCSMVYHEMERGVLINIWRGFNLKFGLCLCLCFTILSLWGLCKICVYFCPCKCVCYGLFTERNEKWSTFGSCCALHN